MRITISMPDEVYDKLEEDRGSVPRSTYIQDLINCFGEGAGNITPEHILGKSSDIYGNHPPDDNEEEGSREVKPMFKDSKLNEQVYES